MSNTIKGLKFPLKEDLLKGWKAYHVFKGATKNLPVFSCHVSVLNPDHMPHPSHAHMEEEILMVLYGEVELWLPNKKNKKNPILSPGQLVYYPANFPHTLKTVSQEPANYLMLKWRSGLSHQESMEYGKFDTDDQNRSKTLSSGMSLSVLFEGKTKYLNKLHCHMTILEKGSGYAPHVDNHDVVMIILEGEVEINKKRLKKNGIAIHPAGYSHGIKNIGENTARYIVFEFHGNGNYRLFYFFRFLKKLWRFLFRPSHWISRTKRLLK
jgi:mannose-6-phosphate isomerase-like protein (cupin superfamily)